MENLHSKFNYGRCPLCDKIIVVPFDVNKVHCCYCGGSFLTKAAIAFYDLKKNVQCESDVYTQISTSHETKQSKPTIPERPTPRFLTIRETAKAIGISEHAIRRMVKDGTIPAIHTGNKSLINLSKMYELIEQGILGY